MIQNVVKIGVPVKDLNRALDFYKEKLGLSLLFNTDIMAFFDCNGLRLMLTHPEKEECSRSSSVTYFQFNNIKDTYAQLAGKEATFIDEPYVVAKMKQTEPWRVFFKDTEDNTHALMSEIQIKKTKGDRICYSRSPLV